MLIRSLIQLPPLVTPPVQSHGNTVNPALNQQFTLTSDFDCATDEVENTPLVWACINQLAGSSDSSSGNTDSATTSNLNSLGKGVAGATALTATMTALPVTSPDALTLSQALNVDTGEIHWIHAEEVKGIVSSRKSS